MHELEMNQFADWTDEEYQQLLSFKPDLSKKPQNSSSETAQDIDDLPDSINWVTEGMVSAVKDQGSCGSCWSFSTTGSIESAHQIATGEALLLSEQQIIDCSVSYGNNGCSGGLVEYAYNFAKHHSIETEDEYPYKAANTECT